MIQPKTLKSLNYFINEEMKVYIDEIEENKGTNLEKIYIGYVRGLESAKHLINQDWKYEED